MTIMEMFDLTKNHKGDILISGAASKYSGSWTISETQGATDSTKLLERCDMARELQASLPRPQAWPGQASPCLLSMETDPGSLNNLYSQLRNWGRGAFPSHQEEKTLGAG